MQIDIDFDVFKALTARRKHEGHTYNEVLREVLGLVENAGNGHISGTFIPNEANEHDDASEGLALRGLLLPNGSELRATYKGRLYRAQIENGKWVARTAKFTTARRPQPVRFRIPILTGGDSGR